jgi:hypothetical protein
MGVRIYRKVEKGESCRIQVSQRSRCAPRALRYDACSVHCSVLWTSGLRLTHIWTAGRGSSKELPAESRPGGQRTVDAVTWNALPDGGPMATLEQGSSGDVVRPLQTLLTNGAAGQWVTTPLGIDGDFRPHTKASVEAFQAWCGVAVGGIVADQTWSVSLHAATPRWKQQLG